MNEFSFIKFGVADDGCNLQLPINAATDLKFFVDDDEFSNVALLTSAGVFIRNITYLYSNGWITITGGTINDQTCFRIGLLYGSTYTSSNLFRYVADISETTLVKYLCYEPQFGFAYDISNSYNQVRLPILIKHPQFPQEDKVYIDGNGVRRLISSKIDKEYELETEYIQQDWHEKLIIALSHDEVYFDGVRLQKSAAYEIDYEEEDKLPCGTILNKASAKMTKNTTIRNNNC